MAKELLYCCTECRVFRPYGKLNPKTIGIIPAQVNGRDTTYFAGV